ncbi:hypothetical protein [Persephonella sp.]
MKIYSVSLGSRIRKGLTVKRQKDWLRYVSFDRKSNNLYLSAFYPEIIYTTASVPPVEDVETLEFLIKTRISGLLEEGKEYSILYFKKEEISETEVLYEVYAVPEELYYSSISDTNSTPENTGLFTVDVFALIPVSEKVSSDVVFHFYTDEEKILVTVSKEKTPLYTRAVQIPESIGEENLTNFYYENFNLTYMFAYQNKRLDISSIVISGKASGDGEFLSLVENLSGLKPVIPEAKDYIGGLSQEDFMEFLLSVGTALLDENFDLTPLKYRKSRAVSKISRRFAAILGIITAAALFGTWSAYSKMKELENKIQHLTTRISAKEKRLLSDIPPDRARYYTSVLELKKQTYDVSPLTVFKKIYPLIEIIEKNQIKIYSDRKSQRIEITGENRFDSLSRMVAFQEELNNRLKQLSQFKITRKMNIDENNYTVKTYLVLERKLN